MQLLMENTKLQPLPLPGSEFSSLRKVGKIYVDKTRLIYSLCEIGGSQVFLARPRRFGKSLLVSTFESLFRYGLRDFHGLAIEELWNEEKIHRVVHLDFSGARDFSDIAQFERFFSDILIGKFGAVGFEHKPAGINLIAQIGLWMDAQPINSLVLLIDEYDAPLAACLHRPELFSQVQAALSRFFLMIKEHARCLRFFFMTGVTKLSNTGIFSGFNNLEDISLQAEFGTLLGYTEEEILAYFGPYLERAAQELGLTERALLESLRANYDGFCFDRKASTHVYCPWSVLNFLDNPGEGFQNYWYASGGQPSVLMNYLQNHQLENPTAFDEPLLLETDVLEAARHYDALSLPALLTQAGYLTIKDVPAEGYLSLGYPNREVRRSMARLYAGELLHGADRRRIEILKLKQALQEGDLKETVRVLNLVFNAIDCARYPVTDEAACRSFLQVLFIGAAMLPQVEVHTAHGRSDLELEVGDQCWVFEIKFARKPQEADALLAEGLRQMQSREYGQTAHGLTLVRAVLVFDGAKRAFSRFALADGPEDQPGN